MKATPSPYDREGHEAAGLREEIAALEARLDQAEGTLAVVTEERDAAAVALRAWIHACGHSKHWQGNTYDALVLTETALWLIDGPEAMAALQALAEQTEG